MSTTTRYYLLATMATLQVLDLLTSRLAFHFGAVELSPIIGFATRPTTTTLLAFKLVSVLIFAVLVLRTKHRWTAYTLCVLFLLINCNNLVVAWRSL